MQILADVRLLGRGGLSGIEEYTRNLLGALLRSDRDNQYTLFYNGWRKEPLDFPGAKIADWSIPNKVFDLASRFIGVPKIGERLGADLVFSPHFNVLASDRVPRVITFHDLSFIHHPYFFSRRQRFWHWLQNIKSQARAAARLIAVSEFTKGDLVDLFGVPPEKISVIYSGVADGLSKAAAKPSGARPNILYLGTLEPRKNVPAIIRAFNILKSERAFADWQLVLAGKPGWLYESIIKEAADSPYRRDIIFKGAVSPEERVLLYNSAEVFVYPSLFEGFGFPPLEAQKCGCPVIVSDRTSLPEVIGESGLSVNPWKVEELAAAIREVAVNRGLREKLIATGYANAARFTWKKTAAATKSLFDSLNG